MKYIFFITLLTITACESVNELVEDANNFVANTEYSLHGPRISYTQNQVRVLFKDYRTAPFRQRQQIYLISNTHGGAVAKAQFRAIRENRNARTFALEAIFPMPNKVPDTFKDSCFHISDGLNSNAKIIAVKPNIETAGFINEFWQANIARPAQIANVNQSLQNNEVSKKKLIMLNEKANRYLETSDIFVNGQCQLPENTNPRPIDPHNGLFSEKKHMSYAICHTANYGDLTVKNKYFLYNDPVSGKLNIYENSKGSFDNSVKMIANAYNVNKFNQKTPTIVEYVSYAEKIFDAADKKSVDCTALSSCSIYDELLYGSSLRNYRKNFESCASLVTSKINKEQSRYQKALNDWQEEPIKQQNFCKAQKNSVDSYKDNFNFIEKNIAFYQNEKNKLESQKKIKNSTNYWRSAKQTTCSLN